MKHFSILPKAVRMDEQQEDFEELLNFKPLTEGLGFNQKQEKKITSYQAKVKVHAIQKPTLKTQPQVTPMIPEKKVSPQQMGELSPFYQTTPAPIKKEPLLVEKKVQEVHDTEASIFSQFFSWIIDLTIVSALLGATLGSLYLISGIPQSEFINFLTMTDSIFYLSFLFCFFYLFYFSIFDLDNSSTFGKMLFGLKVKTSDESKVNLMHSGVRSFITLISIPFLGIPAILDFQGKLSETKLVKRHESK